MSHEPRAPLRRTASGVAWQTQGHAALPCVVITHGAFMSQKTFDKLARALSAHYRVLLWDLPGHGESRQVVAPHRLEGYAQHLLEVMNDAAVAQAIIVGHSFGGMVAQHFIAREPQRVLAFVAYGCIGNHLMRMPLPGLMALLSRASFRFGGADRFARTFVDQCRIQDRDQAKVVEEIRAQIPALRAAIWEAMIRGVHWTPDYRLPCPVAHLRGEWDTRFPGAEAGMQRFCQQLEPELVQKIHHAGHCAHLDQPETFQDKLAELLARLSR